MALRKTSLAEFQSMEFFMLMVGVVGGFAALMIPVFISAGEVYRSTNKISELQRISLAVLNYASDNDERFPPFSTANEVTDKIASKFDDPSLAPSSRSMTWNPAISGMKIKELPRGDETWLLFCPKPGTKDYTLFALADGHGRSARTRMFEDHYVQKKPRP